MIKSFNPAEFVARVAKRLVMEFDDAAQATTPGLVGVAREHPARVQLEKMLPGFVDVGSGVVIDSNRDASKQQDIVIYEKQYCPVFSVNETSEATFFPVEGVIGVGEVKSELDKTKLEDAFSKIASVKGLKRFHFPENDELGLDSTIPFRSYGSSQLIMGTKDQEYNQQNNNMDQVFGFILCGKLAIKPETAFQHAVELWRTYPRAVSPNLIVSLNDGFLQPYDQQARSFLHSSLNANGIAMCEESVKAFPHLIRKLNYVARHGRTVSLSHFGRYLEPRNDEKEIFQVRIVDQFN